MAMRSVGWHVGQWVATCTFVRAARRFSHDRTSGAWFSFLGWTAVFCHFRSSGSPLFLPTRTSQCERLAASDRSRSSGSPFLPMFASRAARRRFEWSTARTSHSMAFWRLALADKGAIVARRPPSTEASARLAMEDLFHRAMAAQADCAKVATSPRDHFAISGAVGDLAPKAAMPRNPPSAQLRRRL